MAQKLVVATSNAGKIVELKMLLADMDVTLVTQGELGVDSPVEDGLSFAENALIKARHAARQTDLPAIADDSGIVVDALNGAPGIHSARYAGVEATDADNNRKLLGALQNIAPANRTGRFFCAAVFVRFADDPCPLIAQASWEGQILENPRGDHGFGYDPLFLIDGDTRSSAQLPESEKNKISHRGQAVKALAMQLKPLLRQS